MGIDFGQLWGQATTAAQNGINDLSKTAVPALEASVEQQAINWLTGQRDAAKQNLANGISEIAARPVEDGSFADIFGSIVKNGAISSQGGMIVAGLVVVVCVGIYLGRG